MCQMENVLFSFTTEMTPKIDEKGITFSLRNRDYKAPQCVVIEKKAKTYRKTGHPQTAEQGQGWEETEVNDTLNIYDNGEVRTPTLVVDDPVGFDSWNLAQTGEVGRTLTTTGGGLNEHLPVVFENHSQDSRYRPLGETCQTVSATYGMGGNNQPFVVNEPIALENHPNDSRIKMSDNGIVQTLSSRMGTGGNNTPMLMEEVGGMQMSEQPKGAVVRRLTPLECNRLQGFPEREEDGKIISWVDIGEWTDSKGKVHKDADSPKYKALGNSIALCWWQWLADRIVKQLHKDGTENPTMGSLFDGIGGFPLVFKRAGCEPIWNSEIEEFPEAVTTKHFGDEEKGIEGDLEKYL